MSSDSVPGPAQPLQQIFGGNSDIGKMEGSLRGTRSDVADLQAAPAPPTRGPATQSSLEDQLNLELGRRNTDTRNFSGGNVSSLTGGGRGDTNTQKVETDPLRAHFAEIFKYFHGVDSTPPPLPEQQQAQPNIFSAPPASKVLLGVGPTDVTGGMFGRR